MNLREEFNRMDHEALDHGLKFYDLRSLLEAVNLSPEDKRNLQDYINKNDAKGANDYLQGLLSGKPGAAKKSNPVAGLQTTQQTINQMSEALNEEQEDDVKFTYECVGKDEDGIDIYSEEYDNLEDAIAEANDNLDYQSITGYYYKIYDDGTIQDIPSYSFTAWTRKDGIITESLSISEDLLREGIYDIIRAIVPKGESPQELARNIFRILDRTKYGAAVRDAFVDIYSVTGESLKAALAKLVDYGIRARIINQKLPESLSRYFELTEGRFDLTPVKCTSQESRKSYWSPYDKKEREFAEYGTRFRYDTRKGCMDAINDPEKDLGYEIDNKKKYHNKGNDKVEEKLILDEANFSSDVQEKDEIDFNGTIVDKDKIPTRILQMIGKPTFKDGRPKMEAWLLIKLYEATIVDGAPCIRRDDLLERCGVALSKREGQSSTFFNHFTDLDLASLHNDYVYPGRNLEDWIKGNANLTLSRGADAGKNYAGGEDLTKFVGQDPLPKKAEQGANPNKSHRGRRRVTLDKDLIPEVKDEFIPEVPDSEGDEPFYFTLDMFNESLSEKEKKRAEVFKKYADERAAKIKAAYREAKQLDEDAEITEADYNDYIFKDMCARKGWPFEKSKKALFRKD